MPQDWYMSPLMWRFQLLRLASIGMLSVVPSSQNCDVPHVNRNDYQLIDIYEDVFVSLFENGNTKDELGLPTDDSLRPKMALLNGKSWSWPSCLPWEKSWSAPSRTLAQSSFPSSTNCWCFYLRFFSRTRLKVAFHCRNFYSVMAFCSIALMHYARTLTVSALVMWHKGSFSPPRNQGFDPLWYAARYNLMWGSNLITPLLAKHFAIRLGDAKAAARLRTSGIESDPNSQENKENWRGCRRLPPSHNVIAIAWTSLFNSINLQRIPKRMGKIWADSLS